MLGPYGEIVPVAKHLTGHLLGAVGLAPRSYPTADDIRHSETGEAD
jgi:hypothetical protein